MWDCPVSTRWGCHFLCQTLDSEEIILKIFKRILLDLREVLRSRVHVSDGMFMKLTRCTIGCVLNWFGIAAVGIFHNHVYLFKTLLNNPGPGIVLACTILGEFFKTPLSLCWLFFKKLDTQFFMQGWHILFDRRGYVLVLGYFLTWYAFWSQGIRTSVFFGVLF